MTTNAAPRIDDRLRRVIAGSVRTDTPAAITRLVGSVAWELGLQRPSYEQVRVLVRALDAAALPRPVVSAAAVKGVVTRTLDFMYQYPGPGLAEWYRHYNKSL